MNYQIKEVDGVAFADTISNFNKYVDTWPLLQQRHHTDGYWWLVFCNTEVVAFAGLVPFDPCPNVGYLKRCYVLPEHRGQSLQQQLIQVRENKAKELGWITILSDCRISNTRSSASFRRAGYRLCDPEQPWEKDSLYWVKEI